MQEINNLTLNEKGACAFKSTTDSLIDLFTLCSKNPYMSVEQFTELYQLMVNCINENPNAFIQLIAFHRGIAKGNGIKHYYYLGMELLEKCCLDPELYKEMIVHTYQYSKDLYYLGNKGIEIYAEKILEQIFSLLETNVSDSSVKYDPMLLKYLAYEGQHWSHQMKQIQSELNRLVTLRKSEFISLVQNTSDFAKDEMRNRIGSNLRQLFSRSIHSESIFTNRVMRILKTTFNKEVNLSDCLFAGKHYDGTLLNETMDENNVFLQESIDKIASDISHTSGIATKLMCKTLKKWQKIQNPVKERNNSEREPLDCEQTDQYEEPLDCEQRDSYEEPFDCEQTDQYEEPLDCEQTDQYEEPLDCEQTDECIPMILSQRKKLLIAGYVQYKLNLSTGKTLAKEIGVDLTSLAYDYYRTGNDPSGLESQLIQRIKRLESDWLSKFDESFTLEQFKNSFVAILDRSVSMSGIPIQTGLLYLLIMVKIFRITEIIYFDSSTEVRKFTDHDIDGPILDLLKKVYTEAQNSTELSRAFYLLEAQCKSERMVMVITDSDCDPVPNSSSTNAFHNAFNTSIYKYLPTNQYIIMNVKETAMKFPYLSFHKQVAYVSGTSTIVFLIDALIYCSKMHISLTPTIVLQRCLESSNFKLSDKITDGLMDSMRFSKNEVSVPEEIDEIYQKWLHRLPKKKDTTLLSLDNDL